MIETIVIKCKNKTIKMDAPLDAHNIVSRIAQEFDVDESRINLKLGGKKVDPSQIFESKARLLAFIGPEIKSQPDFDVSTPVPCKGWNKKCNFYGRESTDGYCSVCYKNINKETSHNAHVNIPPAKKIKHDESSAPIKQTNVHRCWLCNKKVGILSYKCKCEYSFCSKHRLPEMHECKIDFAKIGRDNLTKQMAEYSIENKKIYKI